MPEASWLQSATPAFRLMIATSWLAPASWQDKQQEAIREAIGAGLNWMEFIRLVDRHRTPAMSWAALKRVPGLTIPEPAKKELQKRSDASRMMAVRHCMLLAGVLKTFNRAAIPVMSMKGPILSSELYGDIGLRQSHDLDLVVTPEDIAKAQACLENMGWRLDESWFPMTPRQWQCVLRQEHDLSFVHSHGDCFLELHWRNQWDTQSQANDRWDRSISKVWQGCLYKAMSPTDLVLYLCSHGSIHRWFRAKWLGDLARIHAEGRVDWQAMLGQASKTGQERALLASLRLLQEVYGIPVPDLPGNPWKNLPSFLIASPLRSLKVPEEPAVDLRAMVSQLFRRIYYERLAVPQKTWRDLLAEFVYRREDFRVLRLPDRFFWAYTPLSPILWVWRHMLRYRQKN
jgi:hypothetical protein